MSEPLNAGADRRSGGRDDHCFGHRSVSERSARTRSGSWRPGRRTRRARRRRGTRRRGRSCGPVRRTGCGARTGATRRPAHGSWKVNVWLITPVATVTWAWAWPTPACGRMAVPMRNPSVANATSAWSMAGSSGAPTKRVHTSSSAGPTTPGSLMSTSSTTRTSHAPALAAPALASGRHRRHRVGVADEVGIVGGEQHDRPRAQPVALADGDRAAGEAAPGVLRIDLDLDGASGDAPRANTVWTVLTTLSSCPASAAMMDWAISCPPKTTRVAHRRRWARR